MKGNDLVQQCMVGDRIELSHCEGQIHTLYIDDGTGDLRICRPKLLETTDDREHKDSDWVKFEGPELEYKLRECKACRLFGKKRY